MSSILRTSNHIWLLSVRFRTTLCNLQATYSKQLIRNKNCRKPSFCWSNPRSLQTSCSFLSKQYEAYSESSTVSEKQPSSRWLDQELSKLDNNVRRIGRVRQSEVEKIFEYIKKAENISSTQCLVIIRCCGSLLSEMPVQQRAALLLDIWNTALTKKCLMDISHYNTLLKVYLENDHKFDPIEILSTLEQNNIEPNRVTYHRLISRYCEDGDIGGASKILEFMKSKEMPINESIFHSLIIGHAKSNNMEEAVKILDVMRNADLSPNSATYCALACGYAITGNIEKVLATIEEASTGDNYLSDKDVLDIIFQLTINNHEDHVDQVLPKLQVLMGYSYTCRNVILDLINRGHHEMGYKLLLTLPFQHMADGNSKPVGIFYIKHIVKSGLPKETVLHYCKELQISGRNQTALLGATEAALESKRMDDALAYLKELHSQNIQLRSHYFWPILVERKGDEKAVYETLKLMLDYGCTANYDTFTEYVLPHISTPDPEAIITTLKDIGCDLPQIVNSMCIYYLQEGNSTMAAKIMLKYPVNINTGFITTRLLAMTYIKFGDAESITQILHYLKENPDEKANNVETDLYGRFLQDVVIKYEACASLLEKIMKVMQAKDMKISRVSAERISATFRGNPDITSLLQNLTYSEAFATNVNEQELSKPNLTAISVEEMESDINKRKTQGLRTDDGLQKLLMLHARNKNIERVEELLKELEADGVVCHSGVCAVLLEFYCIHSQLDKAMQYKSLLDSMYPDFHLDDRKIILLAKSLVSNKRYEDAEKILQDHFSKFQRQDTKAVLDKNVWFLLDTLSSMGEVNHTKKFLDLLLSYDCCNPETPILGHLIKSHLVNNDTEGAVNEFIQLSQKHKCTPCKKQLMNQLIQQDDPAKLQAVVDASIAVHGEENTMIELAAVLIDSGRIKQAQKITQTPGFRVKPERLNMQCEMFLKENKINELETFVILTKSMFGADRDKMYFYLLQGYINEKNVAKAVNLWEMMQEENVLPSDQTMHLLGTFLQQMNQPVPFAIPECSDYRMIKIVEANNLIGSDSSQMIKHQTDTLTVTDMSDLVSSLVNKKQYSEAAKVTLEIFSSASYPSVSVLHLLEKGLSEVGDTNTLMELQARTPPAIEGKVHFGEYTGDSFSKISKEESFMKDLENHVPRFKDHFPETDFLSLLQSCPHFVDRARELADVYYNKGRVSPRRVLWEYFMKLHKFEEARKLLQYTPELQQKIFMRTVLSHIRDTNDLAVSEELINQLRPLTDIPERAKGVAYSAHINVLISEGKLIAAVEFVQEVLKSVDMQSLNMGALQRLQTKLKEAGQAVPFVIPERSKNDWRNNNGRNNFDDDRYPR